MPRFDALIVGGGPAGSSCAWALRQAGLDVALLDQATFPHDKVGAGWITRSVLHDLEIAPQDYGREHVLQPFTRFRIGLMDGVRHENAGRARYAGSGHRDRRRAVSQHRLYPGDFRLDATLGSIGSSKVLAALRGGDDPRAIAAAWQPELDAFRARRARYLLY